MTYRAEINGLRALAVLPVIFFHAGFDFFRGGFIGVDIFFVISGYLITTIILEEKSKNRFSLMHFYERRARRILPALILVMFLCIPVSLFLMLPDTLENFGQSLVATALFSNNILLYLTSGYFDVASEYKPLLHTWSLAVEEQFYIIYPLLILFLFRFSKNVIIIILFLIFFASYTSAIYQVSNDDLKFYSLHTRAFELIIGAMLSPYFLGKSYTSNNFFNNFFSLLGIVMILISLNLFDIGDSHPNALTILPIIGTCLIIIFAVDGTIAKKLLSIPFIVYVGLISYSAYLIHQPVIAFLRIGSIEPPNQLILWIAIIFTFIFSHFSYKYIEVPFRNASIIKTKFLLIFLFLSNILIISIGSFLHFYDGFPGRIYSSDAYEQSSTYRAKQILKYKNDSFVSIENTKVLVIGDSFGLDVANVLLESFQNNFELIYAGPDRYTKDADCFLKQNNDDLFNEADLVIFASNYSVKECIDVVIKKSSSKLGIFFVSTKNFGTNLNWILRLNNDDRVFLRNQIINKHKVIHSYQKTIVPSENFISIIEPLSDGDAILITDHNGVLLSDDTVHLTLSGAKYIGNEIFKKSRIADYLN